MKGNILYQVFMRKQDVYSKSQASTEECFHTFSLARGRRLLALAREHIFVVLLLLLGVELSRLEEQLQLNMLHFALLLIFPKGVKKDIKKIFLG